MGTSKVVLSAALILWTGGCGESSMSAGSAPVPIDAGVSPAPDAASPMVTDPHPRQLAFTYGAAETSRTVTVQVGGEDRPPAALSSSPGVRVPSSIDAGQKSFVASIDAAELAVGEHDARVTVSDATDASAVAIFDFQAFVSAPTLSVDGQVLLGGADGLAPPLGQLVAYLD